MRITRIKLSNWKNFREVDVPVEDRVFLVGANASGKSNFLDALRFLRDLVVPGGGFLSACYTRMGVPKLRCLAARSDPTISIEVELQAADALWQYRLRFDEEKNRSRQPRIVEEAVSRDGVSILNRPDVEDRDDPLRLSQTSLEQVLANHEFRPVASAFQSIAYLHLVPQIVRGANDIQARGRALEAYGYGFLERVAGTHAGRRKAHLRRIGQALRSVVPQFTSLEFVRDRQGAPHLQAAYEHWRAKDAHQTEEQFSDGTLRLIGLLWELLDGEGPLLIEEPELSLHEGIVRLIPSLMHKMQRLQKKRVRQVFISTHSPVVLSDEGIAADEVLALVPEAEGTQVHVGMDIPEIRGLMDAGAPAGEAAIPYVAPCNAEQLLLSFR